MAENSIKERIILFCRTEGISIRQFEIQCGMSNGYISSIRKGVGADKVENILNQFPELSRSWLLYGDGNMFNTVYHRIKVVIEKEGITEDEFAKGVDFLFPGVYKRAKRNPGDIDIAKQWVDAVLKLYPKYSRDWLLYGEGEMLKVSETNTGVIINGSNQIQNSQIDNRQYYSDSPDVLRAQIELLDERIKEKDAQIKEKDAQIKEKDAQIKEKDAQIKQLLDILQKK